MPKATVSLDYGPQIELKSLEGAYVCLRPLPYGMRLERQDKASRLSFEMQETKRAGGEVDSQKAEIEFLTLWSRRFDFKYCIGEHNLEDENGTLLDFSKMETFNRLNPRVGIEISALLDKLNGSDEEELAQAEDFTMPLLPSLDPTTLAGSPASDESNLSDSLPT